MQTINNVFKWSFFLTGMTGLTLLTGMFFFWLMIQVLIAVVNIGA